MALTWEAGFINPLYLAVGAIATLFTNQIHSTIKGRSRWDCSFSISVPLLEELSFCFSNIEAFNGYGIQPKFSQPSYFSAGFPQHVHYSPRGCFFFVLVSV